MENQDQNYGKKGGCFLTFLLAVVLFICMLIWIYYKNQEGLN